MAHRLADPLLTTTEPMPAATALRQMLKTPIDTLGRDQLPRLALMARLSTGLAHRALIRLTRQATPLGPGLTSGETVSGAPVIAILVTRST
jgi:hypothetical protein